MQKHTRNRAVIFLLTAVLLLTLIPMVPAAEISDFTDLDPDHWAYEDISAAVETGLFEGVGAGVFNPEGTMNRAMFVTVAMRLMDGTPGTETPFDDVSPDAWYFGAVAWGYASGVIQGVSETRFAPEKPVTRQEGAVLLARAFSLTEYRGNGGIFTDETEITRWAYDAVLAMAEADHIAGYPDGSFRPAHILSRAEAAVLYVRLLENEEPEPSPEPTMTPLPPATPKPTATPRPTSPPRPTASPGMTSPPTPSPT